jgi:hypothetical protein
MGELRPVSQVAIGPMIEAIMSETNASPSARNAKSFGV